MLKKKHIGLYFGEKTMRISKEKVLSMVEKVKKQISTVFVGKEQSIHTLLTGFFSGLHVLIEDIPGVGKTTLARTLAKSTGMDFGRIQFTPDLLPGDVLGMTIWSVEKRDFVFKKGAIMHQFILADEINRASAQTQSALLEAMQEGAVTVDGVTHPLPQPFFVIATQNPISFTGTFQLPEAQIDRFGMSFSMGYPMPEEEVQILDRFQEKSPLDTLEAVTSPEEIVEIKNQVRKVYAGKEIKDFLISISNTTRKNRKIRLGMSPRATQHLLLASQAQSLMSGRDFIIPEDVLQTLTPVLKHRLILSADAKIENLSTEDVIKTLINSIALPAGLK
jgi:MoxR-like ATPase